MLLSPKAGTASGLEESSASVPDARISHSTSELVLRPVASVVPSVTGTPPVTVPDDWNATASGSISPVVYASVTVFASCGGGTTSLLTS
jgi:hypothetical protein